MSLYEELPLEILEQICLNITTVEDMNNVFLVFPELKDVATVKSHWRLIKRREYDWPCQYCYHAYTLRSSYIFHMRTDHPEM